MTTYDPTRYDAYLKSRLGAIAGILARRNLLRAMVQALWLAVAVFGAGLALSLWRGWPLTLRQYALSGLGIGLLYIVVDLLLNRVNTRYLARRLDERLGLHEQTATALDVAAQPGERSYVEGLLLHQAGDTLAQAEQRVRRLGWLPWREIETLVATLFLAAGLYFLTGMGTGLPSVTPRPLPGLPGAAKQNQPPAFQPQAPDPAANPTGGLSDAARRALEALASALGDQAATAATAEALREGDVAGAADALRRLADQVNGLSQEGRRDVAQALRRGAQATQADAPSLADQLRRSANGVERGGTQAQRSLEDLAAELERLGQSQPPPPGAQPGQAQAGQGQGQGQGPGQGQGQGQQGQGQGRQGQGQAQGQGQGAGQGTSQQKEGSDDRAGAEGVPVELAAQPDPSEPPTRRADPNAQTQGTASGGQFGQGGSPSSGAVQAGSDPLRYPWELRGVVQEYFTPSR